VPRKGEPPLSRDVVLTLLAAAPGRLAALTDGLTDEQLRTAPAPGEWSANDVLAHLRSCADMWGGGIETILRREQTTMRAVNPRHWIKSTDYPVQAFRPSLEAFRVQREALLRVLEGLTDEEWTLSITATGAGKPLQRTVSSFAERLAVHERPHLKQVERVVAALLSGGHATA
jgi:hypothetical protein